MHARTRERIVSHYLPQEQLLYAQEQLQKAHVSPLVYSFIDERESLSWTPDLITPGQQKQLDSLAGDPRFRPVEDPVRLFDGQVFYITCIDRREALLHLYEQFKDDPRYACLLQRDTYSENYFFELFSPSATKARGVLRLKEILGCDRIVAFGDGVNDLSMFAIADECYAPANAEPETKAAATGIIGSNSEDGVAHFLQERIYG